MRRVMRSKSASAKNVGSASILSAMSKQRLSASVDEELLATGQAAVRDGRASTMSDWVNQALKLMVEHDRALCATDDFIASYEAEHGVITQEEMDAATRWADETAVKVRRPAAPKASARKRRRGAA